MSTMNDVTGSAEVVGAAATVEEFIARVLHRAHHTAEAGGAPDEARMILGLARLFADEPAAISEEFDRERFIKAAIHETADST